MTTETAHEAAPNPGAPLARLSPIYLAALLLPIAPTAAIVAAFSAAIPDDRIQELSWIA